MKTKGKNEIIKIDEDKDDQEEIREEVVHKDLSTKTIYFYIDSKKKINQKSREVYKNKDYVIHYPINYNGGPKYKKVKKLIYEGFGDDLPTGVNKAAKKGLGFTKTTRPLIDLIDETYNYECIKFTKHGQSSINEKNKELCLSADDFNNIYTSLKNISEKHKSENQKISAEELHKIFPKVFKTISTKYIKDSVAIALSNWEQSMQEFSEKDKLTIHELFFKLSLTDDFLNNDLLLKTKETIDLHYIDDIMKEFNSFMQQKTETDTLEKKWQKFFKDHNWIFSHVFSIPIVLLEDEAYVGGKNISNKDGKITDFLIKNDLTNNVAFLEIKTHKTELIKKGNAYRGTDVFCMSSDLSGAISQVLNQRDNFQKHFSTLRLDSDHIFETFNSKCIVLMGSISSLNLKEVKSFELFRSNSKDVEILTFDELYQRFINLKDLMSK